MPRVRAVTAEAFGGRDAVLYVEGQDELSLDPHVLSHLLGPLGVDVRGLGGCEEIEAAFRALRWADEAGAAKATARPYYCVVDRDHRADDEVEARWTEFMAGEPKPLYWRRHEMENYFLEPEFVVRSLYAKPSATALEIGNSLVRAAQKRVYLDCANLVLKELRMGMAFYPLKELTPKDGNFGTPQDALGTLLAARDYAGLKRDKQGLLTHTWLARRLKAWVRTLTGSSAAAPLGLGAGRWLELCEGKKLIGEVICDRHFRVDTVSGGKLKGGTLIQRVVQDLMERFDELPYQPQDLAELRAFFASRPR